MTDAETIDTALKIIYIDPLIEDAVIDFKSTKSRWSVALGDELMHPYIQRLDEEIFSDPPIFTPSTGETAWREENLGDMATQLMDQARTHGWAVVQFYTETPNWRVFGQDDFIKWVYLNTNSHEIIGAEFRLDIADVNQICVWDYNQCYLIKWKEGDNKGTFAYSDISQALWTTATIARQIRNQLDVMGAKPEFPHVIYGDNITPAQRAAIMNALDDTSITNGIGASEKAVKEIKMIPHTLYSELMSLLDQRTKRFAGLTRLPYAFYNGERDSQGLGEKGELIVEMKIDKRKQHIFNKIKSMLIKLYQDRYGISLSEVEMDLNEVEENEVEEVEENEQDTETTNIKQED